MKRNINMLNTGLCRLLVSCGVLFSCTVVCGAAEPTGLPANVDLRTYTFDPLENDAPEPDPKGRVFYVMQKHPKAADANPGTRELPFKTIAHSVKGLVANDIVYVGDGIYRESVYMYNQGRKDTHVVLRNLPGHRPSLRGSDIVAGWTKKAPGLWTRQWDKAFPPTVIGKRKLTIPFSGIVAVKGKRLTWGDSAASLKDGEFTFNHETKVIQLKLAEGIDPNRDITEISVRRIGIKAVGIALKIRGLDVRHVASSYLDGPQGGAIDAWGYNIIIENCTANDNLLYGIKIKGVNHLLRRNIASGNGGAGINGSLIKGILSDNITDNNCWGLQYNVAAGVKIVGEAPEYNRIVRHISRGNGSFGIWFDYACRNNTIENCFLYNNGRSGIFIEHSDGPNYILNNLILNTRIGPEQKHGGGGIRITNSDYVYMVNNTFAYNEDCAISVLAYGRRKIGYEGGVFPTSRHLFIKNNIFYKNGRSAYSLNGYATKPDVPKTWTVSNNVYVLKAGTPLAKSPGPLTNKSFRIEGLDEWKKFASHGANSIEGCKDLFADEDKFTLKADSPAKGAAANIDFLIERLNRPFIDFFGQARPAKQADIGAVQHK